MNNKSERPDRLLAETLHDGWDDGPGAAFAQQAAALARRRRRARQTLVAAGTAAAATLVLSGLWLRPEPVHSLPPPTAAVPAYEVISDEQLLAQLRDRPLLVLPRENGTREFVLLDR